jgi:uncharacterized membrane protein YkvA (DUF1232 family)
VKFTSLVWRARTWARKVKLDAVALWIASRDPRVSLHAKLVCVVIAAYALSPIDLIPDFIPVLGLLDELVLLPLAMLLAVRLVPPDLMAEFRAEAGRMADRPVSRTAAAVVLVLWLALAGFGIAIISRWIA